MSKEFAYSSGAVIQKVVLFFVIVVSSIYRLPASKLNKRKRICQIGITRYAAVAPRPYIIGSGVLSLPFARHSQQKRRGDIAENKSRVANEMKSVAAEEFRGTNFRGKVIFQCHNCRFRAKYGNFVIKTTPLEIYLSSPGKFPRRASSSVVECRYSVWPLDTDLNPQPFATGCWLRRGLIATNAWQFMVVIYLGRRGNTCNYASITRVTNARPGGFYHWRAVVARELGFRGGLE